MFDARHTPGVSRHPGGINGIAKRNIRKTKAQRTRFFQRLSGYFRNIRRIPPVEIRYIIYTGKANNSPVEVFENRTRASNIAVSTPAGGSADASFGIRDSVLWRSWCGGMYRARVTSVRLYITLPFSA